MFWKLVNIYADEGELKIELFIFFIKKIHL